jgi:hypothetical protein
MHRTARLLVSLASLSVLVGTGCVQDQELLVVRGAIGLDEECVLDDSVRLANDTLDVSIDAPFALGLLVANVQTGNGGSNTGIEDDGEIKLEYAEVRLSLSGGNPAGFEGEFEVAIPTDSVPSGEELGMLITVPTSVAQSLRGSVAPGDLPILEMSVVLVGERTAQAGAGKLGEVRTREYSFPFTLCNGCVPCPKDCGLPQSSDCTQE